MVSHIVGATTIGEAWWGVHFYRFLPPAALWMSCACLLVGMVVVARDNLWPDRFSGILSRAVAVIPRWLRISVGGVFSLAVFWAFRERHTFLGDGTPLTENLPRGQMFHPDEPLSLYLHQCFYRLTNHFFASPGRSLVDVAHDTVGLSSALAGALFIPVAWQLARELTPRSESATINTAPTAAPPPIC